MRSPQSQVWSQPLYRMEAPATAWIRLPFEVVELNIGEGTNSRSLPPLTEAEVRVLEISPHIEAPQASKLLETRAGRS